MELCETTRVGGTLTKFDIVGFMEIHPDLSDEERDFYFKSYPTYDLVRDKKLHCTVCRMHIGAAPNQVEFIKMHPILRVTHCNKCHDFYNSGEFSKGEDGSELYCRWCGQGGEVFCCSKCPYVFCKSCITKNLPRSVIDEIETNENWQCFNCSPMVLWTLRAQHWALMNYIAMQKKKLDELNLSAEEYQRRIAIDTSTCCRIAKERCGAPVDRRQGQYAISTVPKKIKRPPSLTPEAKRPKRSNDEVVCTPDLSSMLEPDCQLTVKGGGGAAAASSSAAGNLPPGHSTPKILSINTNYGGGSQLQQQQQATSSKAVTGAAMPPLVLRNTPVTIREESTSTVVRRSVPNKPVYHTINGFRIDLKTAARQDTFRLPNGKLIQVKRQEAPMVVTVPPARGPPPPPQRTYVTQSLQGPPKPIQITGAGLAPPTRAISIRPVATNHTIASTQSLQPPQQQQQQMMGRKLTMVGNTTVTALGAANGQPSNIRSGQVTVRAVAVQNGAAVLQVQQQPQVQPQQQQQNVPIAPRPQVVMVKHVYPNTAIGQARSQMQDKVFAVMEACQHLTTKIHSLTNSNAYKEARNLLEVKELYIHLSYLLTYSLGRFKTVQDKCFEDMRKFGFETDANSLQKGQLAAGVDYVRYGGLTEEEAADIFGPGENNFAEQIYEYRRKMLKANGDEADERPLSPFVPLKDLNQLEVEKKEKKEEESELSYQPIKEEPPELLDYLREEEDEEFARPEAQSRVDASYDDDEDDFGGGLDANDDDDDYYPSNKASSSARASTEEYMNRGEENHAYDHKLTRIMAKYPSIWCTKHFNYGNFEVTRKEWRTIAAHFGRADNVKLRWKNIRKRYVRIENRIKAGKRFHGYFDKATNFLANRDLPLDQWIEVDCGYEEDEVAAPSFAAATPPERLDVSRQRAEQEPEAPGESTQPIDLLPLDLKIINFVKSNPIMWRKDAGKEGYSSRGDAATRRHLWLHLWKSLPMYKCEEIVDRWQHLYEMYKTFRLKTIKDKTKQSNLELKYAKYLAKLFFLYKIDEEVLANDAEPLEEFNLTEAELETQMGGRLRDLPDDRDFVRDLAIEVAQYPQLWDSNHKNFYDCAKRNDIWTRISNNLAYYNRSQTVMKLRWMLAQYCYMRLNRKEDRPTAASTAFAEYCNNLPLEYMSFLDNN